MRYTIFYLYVVNTQYSVYRDFFESSFEEMFAGCSSLLPDAMPAFACAQNFCAVHIVLLNLLVGFLCDGLFFRDTWRVSIWQNLLRAEMSHRLHEDSQ